MKTTPAVSALALALACAMGASNANAQVQPIRVDGDVQSSVTQLGWTVDGPFALRRIELVVRNPHDRPLEATVRLPLAANERLRGYALDVEGRMRDAVPVERVQARVAFEEVERRGVDPALAEKDADNSYRIRVFPVPAHGERRVRIEVASLGERRACGWEHTLAGGLPASSTLQASATVSLMLAHGGDAGLAWTRRGNGYTTQWAASGARGARTVCIHAPAGDAAFVSRFDDGLQMHWLEVPVTHARATTATAFPSRLEIVWDASYSMLGKDRRAELELLANYLRGHPVDLTLRILRESVQTTRLRIATPSDIDALIARLRAEQADGATALTAWQADPRAERVLVFSDAVATLPGPTPANAHVPVFVISRGIGNPALARWLTRSGGQVLDLSTTSGDAALRALTDAPALSARLGPLDGNWHLERVAANSGALRGCHVANAPSTPPQLRLMQRSASGTTIRSHGSDNARTSELAAFWCATWQAEDLEAQPEHNRTQLAELGQRFGVPNAETSLLVLETDADYIRNGILPPEADASLHAEVMAARAAAEADKAKAWADNRVAIAAGWQARIDWWNTRFPKDAPPAPKIAGEGDEAPTGDAAMRREERNQEYSQLSSVIPPPSPPPPAPSAMAAADAAPMEAPLADAAQPPAYRSNAVALNAPGTATANAASPAITMQLQALAMDSPYIAQLQTAQDATTLYQRYLDLRSQYGQSPAFHFDMAQRLFELHDPVLGWRVLSNLVELMPTQQAALRLVAYRLQEAGMQAQAIALLRRIVLIAPDEPQSFRDLALALSSPATCREALDLFQHVVDSPWDSRFADIGLIALAERNDLRTRCPNASIRDAGEPTALALPVGLRVILRWDLNDTDIDLHVTDPNNEEVHYAHRSSYQGGALSRDFTGGYGPEEFILRDPKPGDYQVSVVYFGSRLAQLARGATINISLQTGFGTPGVKQQTISMRLLERTGNVLVGRFHVTANGQLEVAPAPAGPDTAD
ncbi:MAG: DUF2135 domain-containing protein [Thermomonas sp.]|uniref:VIT domain-containing protein n=1 Tax=Thermomonas sp. TaxID=1971895 RepID=UPI002607C674|nr:VIT domain-containing protein [Thermomonas sp.]MCC7097546.1 DUF2135 domain-containing protein [Thermomonas sp.]